MTHDELILHRQRLLTRSAELRQAFSDDAQALKRPLAVIDQARLGIAWLCRNPQWPLGALLVLAVVKPRTTILWSGRLWWGWKTFVRARQLLSPRIT